MPISGPERQRDLIFEEEDLAYEEEILRHPFSVKCWLRYAEHKSKGHPTGLHLIYERALKELPGSYKLWYNYLKLRRKAVKGRCITDPGYEDVNNAFERALVFMHKMPRIWLDYCQFLMDQCKVTRTRRTFDRALRALPISQHHRIWPLYLKFVRSMPLQETAVRVYRRYLKLCCENAEEYIEYLVDIMRLDEGAVRLADIVNQEAFVSKEGKSNHQLWHDLCELICKHPTKVTSLKVDPIIRGGIKRFTDERGKLWCSLADYYIRSGHFEKVDPIIRGGIKRFTDERGKLWCSLADYYIRSGHFEKARDIYEESIFTVTTVRDFTQVFDAYAQFEESMLKARMETSAESGSSEDDDIDIELRLERFEDLMDRRPLLLNSVLLRQNPHNVHEWHKRAKLFEGKPKEVINTYTEAVQTVSPQLATGKLHTLWVEFAKFYEKHGQIMEARVIFEKGTKVEYMKVDELAGVWCEWTEMEIRHENYDDALKLMRRATAAPGRKAAYHDKSEPVQNRLYKNLKLWSMYADLEESFGTFKSTKAVYDRIIDLRIATPQIIINYGMFLEENQYFEEAFKAYEKGIGLFKWPNVYDIWNTYLTKFTERYGGKKLERTRDLFEQCLEDCPPKFTKTLYLLYAKLEENYGLSRHAVAVYDRATKAVLPAEQHEMFNIYIKRVAEVYGVTQTRPIYEKAIDLLPDIEARDMCIRFADLERKLGEIDRARAVYAHCSQMCDPRITATFWQVWKDFEIKHGNEDTVREMLRIKRSIQAKFNTQVNFMSAQMIAAEGAAKPNQAAMDDMQLLEQRAQALAAEAEADKPKLKKDILFVRGDTEAKREAVAEATRAANPAEINIDDDEDEDSEEEVDEVNVEQKSIPTEVFGSIKADQDAE